MTDRADLTPESLVGAYAQGAFPMADPATGEVQFYTCDPRSIVQLPEWCPPKSLARVMRSGRFELRVNTAFGRVIQACAADRSAANRSWISDELRAAYERLHEMGFAHSVEAWVGPHLAGGLYGVALGGAFFGESMFTVREPWARDASKVAFAALIKRLRARGFVLLDSQYSNPHMESLGATEIPARAYAEQLAAALRVRVSLTDE